MRIESSPAFDRYYKKLPINVKELFKKKVKLLLSSNFEHPSLRVKKIKGTKNIWEASITKIYRFTFEKITDGVRLRVIGKHDILKK
ncbi:unnamed protein product [marine sediment metagenome]|uniref:Cytotoxin n=2 Tax=marine sediment metagenome TaxID=412755 RepID=X1AHP8_9ZZZZ